MVDIVKLRTGEKIDQWTVVEKLGEGGFGSVYKVARGDEIYALKTESLKEKVKVLKMEVYVLRLAKDRKSKHFCTCKDTGIYKNCLYLVMTLVGPCLQTAGFRGTIRYASLSCHIQRETCRKDDIESWLYQQIELTRGALPWRSLDKKKDDVAMYKERCRFEVGLKELMGGCPREYIEILRYVDSLRFYDTPDYDKIYKILKRAMTSLRVQDFPYDWEKTVTEMAVPAHSSDI